MRVELDISATTSTGRSFIGWSPVKASVRVADAGGAHGNVAVTLRNGGTPTGGRVVFDTVKSDADKSEVQINLASDGTPSTVWIAGEFKRPSRDYGDTVIEVVGQNQIVGRRELMVRIRKDATVLSSAERDRFLTALGKLNDRGHGIFQNFRDTHVAESANEAHGYPGFPPWHRAYVLDLERTLQAIDDTVALPYWRFDQAAKALFAPEFLGMPPADPQAGDVVDFPHGHPLEFWRTDGSDAIERRPRYSIDGPPAQEAPGPGGQMTDWVISEQATLNLGTNFSAFRRLERAPHGSAHVSFDGPINYVPTAAKDPLFFLLHCNIDRLWAKWQWFNKRWDSKQSATYALTGLVREPDNLGHKLGDTMWPWNGAVGDGSPANPRPVFPPPRQPFPDSPLVSRPGRTPAVGDMIDFQGVLATAGLGFDYDDVPFELP